MNISKLLWFGPMQPETRMLGSTAATPAAIRWTQGLLTGLSNCGVEIAYIGHEPARVWPFGPFVSRAYSSDSETRRPNRCKTSAVREFPIDFLNVPGLRWYSLGRSYDRATAFHIRSWRPSVVVTYNADRSYLPAIKRLSRMGVPWVPIVLDGDDSPAGWEDLAARAGVASSGVFLSHAACQSSPFRDTFHLDGGIDVDPLPDEPLFRPQPLVFYAGSRSRWAGVDLLLDAWPLVTAPGAALWLCGQGRNDRLDRAVMSDARITDFGVVAEKRLRELMTHATVLVNPRPPDCIGNTLNFPSKLLDYLGTGKPVVSTWTPGLSPHYRESLVVADPASPAVLAARIDEVLRWSEEQRSRHRAEAADFCRRHGNWNVVAERFLAWLNNVI